MNDIDDSSKPDKIIPMDKTWPLSFLSLGLFTLSLFSSLAVLTVILVTIGTISGLAAIVVNWPAPSKP